MKLFFLLLVISTSLFGQTDWERWQKNETDYRKENFTKVRDYSFRNLGFSDALVKSSMVLYWTIISDVDGDNCPFHPSCSAFLIDAVQATNIVEGTLLFFDRFTRDTNPFNRNKYYPYIKPGKFYDPVANYVHKHPED